MIVSKVYINRKIEFKGGFYVSKFKSSIKSLECGNRILKIVEPIYMDFKKRKALLSEKEQEITETIIGSQLGLACEYYLKGLIIPNINISIPYELKDYITSLSEEQELMIIVSDEEKIKNDPVLGKLNKKQLRLLMDGNSLKNIGHSLIHLLGSRTMNDNKRIYLKENVRRSIITSLKSKLHNGDAKTDKEMLRFLIYLSEPIQGSRIDEDLDNADKIIEDEIAESRISDAFPKGRYGIFDGFSPNIDWLYEFAFSIRTGIKHQYPNMIELLKNKDELIGKFIYPDPETTISVIEEGE